MSEDVFALKDNHRLYEVLGVPRDATEHSIKKAYHKLAMKFHPDKNPSGADKFKEISFAYNILADEEQRRMYDNKTLRTHIEGKARSVDPEMDPNVELSSEDLRQFVERIHNESRSADQRRREFTKRREEELARQAAFDRAHPNFSMPSHVSKAKAHFFNSDHISTSADMLERLNRMEESKEEAREDESAMRASASPVNGPFTTMKQRMMAQYRNERETKGIATTRVDQQTENIISGAEAKYSKVDVVRKQATGPRYVYDVNTVRRNENFNYEEFILRRYSDGGTVLPSAILADALDRYEPEDPTALKKTVPIVDE